MAVRESQNPEREMSTVEAAGGGCGQLWFVQQWMKDNPELARPTNTTGGSSA